MKYLKLVVLGFVVAVISSCNTENAELVSKWLLTEQLADPGDGSGVFMPVTSQKEIEFFEDGSFNSNGSLCVMDIYTTDPSSGTYDDNTMIIDVNGCTVSNFPRTYEILADTLILNYPCIEACREKFIRIE